MRRLRTLNGPRRSLFVTAIVAVVAATALSAGGAAHGASGDENREAPADRPADAAPEVPADTSAALATLQQRIAAYVEEHGTAYTFGSYADPATGRIVLETDAPDEVVAALTDTSDVSDMPGASAAEIRALEQVKVRERTASDDSRRSDSPPFWGGAGITNQVGVCSAGYSVNRPNGTRDMVTAGHCFANGATVWTESLTYVVGTVFDRRLPTVSNEPRDMERIGGQSYAGRIFSGGVDSSTSRPVYGAGDAVVGFNNYCRSGRTTGEICGYTATSTTGQVCTGTGCKSPVIVYTGTPVSQGGDSGAPFYAFSVDGSGVHIRGHHIASNGVDTMYAEKWTEVARLYGVTITTG